jgi:outer membrane immunogenic protein
MRLLLLGFLGFFALACGSATAADLPVKARPAPPPAVAAWSWAGLYVGGHFGYGWAFPEMSEGLTGVAIPNPPRPRGILGGVQAGYNLQAGPWVYGIEADYTWSRVAGSSDCVVPQGVVNCRGEPDTYATVAGRLGYAADRTLWFAKGGAAWMDEGFRHLAVTIPTCAGTPCTGSNSTWGWTVGGGVEYAFDPNWSVKLEYTYLDYPKLERVVVSNGVSQDIFDLTRTFHLVKLGINYRFSSVAVTARY